MSEGWGFLHQNSYIVLEYTRFFSERRFSLYLTWYERREIYMLCLYQKYSLEKGDINEIFPSYVLISSSLIS